jgi:hypothetical protein
MPQAVTGRGCLYRGTGGGGGREGCLLSPPPPPVSLPSFTPRHGLNNYKDTRPEMASLLVFNSPSNLLND